MTKYKISSVKSGAELGVYDADSREQALDKLAQDAGYRDAAEAREVTGDDGQHLRVEEQKMYAVRVIGETGAQDYQSVYGECPEDFQDREQAEQWAQKLSTSGHWPQGNPGYEVVEL